MHGLMNVKFLDFGGQLPCSQEPAVGTSTESISNSI